MRKPVWLSRPVAILALAEAVSGAGTWLTAMAVVSILIFRGEGGVAESSGIMLAGLLPLLVAAPLAGRLADRWDRRWLMAGSEVLSGAAVAMLLLARTPAQLYALLAIQSACGAVIRPARLASVRSLVPAADLPRVNAFLNQVSSVIKVAAPALGGGFVAVVGPHPAMALDVVSYFISAALLATLPALLPPAAGPSAAAAPGGGRAALRSSPLRVLVAHGGLRTLATAGFLAVLVISGLDLLMAVFVKEYLGGSAALLGVLIAGIGGGAIASGGWLMLRRTACSPWSDLRLGILLLAVLILSVAAAGLAGGGPWAVPVVMAAAVLGGVGNGLTHVQFQTLIQELSPAEHLGGLAGLMEFTFALARVLALAAIPLFVPGALSIGGFFALGGAALLLLVAGLTWLTPAPGAGPAPTLGSGPTPGAGLGPASGAGLGPASGPAPGSALGSASAPTPGVALAGPSPGRGMAPAGLPTAPGARAQSRPPDLSGS